MGQFVVRPGYLEVTHLAGQNRGGNFDTNPRNIFPARHVVAFYDVYLPEGWDPVKGGKLLGFCYGTKRGQCSNGRDWKKGEGSVRVMWHRGGHANLYVYMTTGDSVRAYNQQQDDYKRVTSIGESKKGGYPGHDVWDQNREFTLKPGKNSVAIEVRMNTPGQSDGILGLQVNGVTKTLKNVVLRSDPNEMLTSFRMTSFYGGNDSSWSPKNNTVMHFRSFKFLKVDS